MKIKATLYKCKRIVDFLCTFSPIKDSMGEPAGIRMQLVEGGSKLRFTVNTNNYIAISDLDVESEGELDVVIRSVDLSSVFTAFFSIITREKKSEERKVMISIADFGLKFRAVTKNSVGKRTYITRTVPVLHKSIGDVIISDSDEYIKLPFGLFHDVLVAVSPSVSISTTISGVSGVSLIFEDGVFKAVSTNSVTLSECSMPIKGESSLNVVVPNTYMNRFMAAMAKLNDVDEIGIRATGRMCVFKSTDFLAVLPLSVESFPNYTPLLNEVSSFFVINTKEFTANLRSIVHSTNKNDNYRLSLRMFDSSLIISTLTAENDAIPVENTGGSLHIDINVNLLLNALSHITAEKVVLHYSDNKSPIILKPFSTDVLVSTYIIAPLR